MKSRSFVVLALVCAACASPRTLPKEQRPTTVSLKRHESGLRLVEVGVAAQHATFAFDTGAGVTVISPDIAKSADCKPMARLVGFRMHGQRVDMGRCDHLMLGIDTQSVDHDTVGVLEMNTMMSKEAPTVDGVISLHSFAPRPLTLDLKRDRLVLETNDSLSRVKADAIVPMRVARTASGLSVDPFIAVSTPAGQAWFLVDSGNTGATLVAPSTLTMLGLTAPAVDASGQQKMELELPFADGVALKTQAVVDDTLIYDGVLSVEALEQMSLTLDFPRQSAWVHIPKG